MDIVGYWRISYHGTIYRYRKWVAVYEFLVEQGIPLILHKAGPFWVISDMLTGAAVSTGEVNGIKRTGWDTPLAAKLQVKANIKKTGYDKYMQKSAEFFILFPVRTMPVNLIRLGLWKRR